MREPLKVLDLFSGIGGFSLGLERTGGFKTVAFCEIEEFPRRVLAKHWPHVPIFHDVRELRAEHVGAVDVICGGFPCQDISSAGQRAGIDGQRSGLWGEIARLVGELRPRYVIVENVARLLADGMGRVLGDLSALGYDAEWEVISASGVGAPHLRDRVWIVAYPQKGMCNRVLLSGARHEEGHTQGFQRVRAMLSARRAGRRPAADFGRVHKADGLSAGVAAISHLGNAVVPQIPEIIGRAILASITDGADSATGKGQAVNTLSQEKRR